MKKIRKKALTFVMSLVLYTGSIFAQSPGGIDSPVLWLQTRPVTSDLKGDYYWANYSTREFYLADYVSNAEFLHNDVRFFNGHAALPFSPAITFPSPKEVLFNRSTLSQTTMIGLFAPSDNFSGETLLYGLSGRPGQGIWLGNNKIYHSLESGKGVVNYGETEGMNLMYSGNDSEELELFKEGSMRIVSHNYALPPVTDIWGESPKSALIFGNDALVNGQPNISMNSTFDIPVLSNQAFTGYIPEFIVYNRWLSPIERRKVNTYLAIKYGISLPCSYIGSDGELLWDYSANSSYNHRITGLYRDYFSGLNQLESSTSYEETNHAYANDFYYNDDIPNDFSTGNPYCRTTSNRLLTIARQYGDEPEEQSYLLWGDDNRSTFELDEVHSQLFGLQKMERNWRVSTNKEASYMDINQYPLWYSNYFGLVPDEFSTRMILYAAESPTDTGTAFTYNPLSGNTGYLCVENWNYVGDLYLKFGDNSDLLTPDSHDYGYYIQAIDNNDASVYPIIQGTVSNNSVATFPVNSRLEVEKDVQEIRLRINGILLPETGIMIDFQDKRKPFYGGIGLTQDTSESRITVREGGFDNTGYRIELSYADLCAPEFSMNTDEQNSLLLLYHEKKDIIKPPKPDKRGNFLFYPEGGLPEIIEASEIDTQRKKVIFNNVFFYDKDVFSFAHRESNLYGQFQVTNPSCPGSGNDGWIGFNVWHGSPPFTYTLKEAGSGNIIQTDIAYQNYHTITDLSPGDYSLQIEEGTGFSFNTWQEGEWARTANYLEDTDGSIEWIIGNETDAYWIGFLDENENNTGRIYQYGVRKINGSIVVPSVLMSDIQSNLMSYITQPVSEGDRIKIVKSQDEFYVYVNDEEIYSSIGQNRSNPRDKYIIGDIIIGEPIVLPKFHGVIQAGFILLPGELQFIMEPIDIYEILNVETEGFSFTNQANWDYSESMTVTKGYGSSIEYEITITDDCTEHPIRSKANTTAEPSLEAENPNFSVFAQHSQVKTRLELNQPEALSLAVYNANGTEVKLIENRTPQKIHENEFSLPVNGVYIIKAITTTSEFTEKIIIY